VGEDFLKNPNAYARSCFSLWVLALGVLHGDLLSSCETCRHFTGRSGPHGICSIWQRALTGAMAAVQRCSLWQGRGR
jgi:hypothetical protein